MIKRFAPLAMLFGLLTALMLGSASTALAHPPGIIHAGFNCNNVVGVGVVCKKYDAPEVTVIIKNTRFLTYNELSILEHVLNSIPINVFNPIIYINNVKLAVVNVFNNTFYIPITVGDVTVPILPVYW